MQPEAKKYLFDIWTAANLLDTFVSGKDFAEYQDDPMLRAATERQFEVIGEAISQLARIDPATAADQRIPTNHCISEHPDSWVCRDR
jgi:uncharacterized protein with HEPN domain